MSFTVSPFFNLTSALLQTLAAITQQTHTGLRNVFYRTDPINDPNRKTLETYAREHGNLHIPRTHANTKCWLTQLPSCGFFAMRSAESVPLFRCVIQHGHLL